MKTVIILFVILADKPGTHRNRFPS